ncbi:hypothetical protein M8J76_003875 [Diaphorina citri]|nr:hypothetical protein M8J76_003875 [Diaphorina citri]
MTYYGLCWIFQTFLLIVFFVKVSRQFEDNRFLSPIKFQHMRTTEIIRYWGYPAEEHKVTTEDGYILTNFRIPNRGGYPLLFLHGLTSSSDCFLGRNPSVDIVFLLWKRGYDIWLWNARGNLYSREHVNLTTKQSKFYQFSYHEMGLYDTPALIDYILAETDHKTLITLGHSLGSTNVLIATSLRPEYQAKRWIFDGNTQSVLEIGKDQDRSLRKVCGPKSPVVKICMTILALVSGFQSNQTVESAVLKLMTKFPSSSSLNTIKQVIQNIETGEFKPLSYGIRENLRRYGTPYPPLYPIGNINTPSALYFGCCNDLLSSSKDSHILRKQLRNVVKFYEIPYKRFSHGDFLWAVESYRLIYKDTIDLIEAYNPGHFTDNQIAHGTWGKENGE